MNAYVIGADILGNNANDSTADLCRARPMSADNAHRLIALCVRRLQGNGIGKSPTATQLVNIDESIVLSGKKTLPDSAADVLCGLAARATGECEILGGENIAGDDPRPYWARGINPYLEVSPIYDYPPDDEWLVPKPGGGHQRVILGERVGAGEMQPGGWWYTGSYRGPWWGGNGPFMDVDDFVDPMENVSPSVLIGMIDIQSAQAEMNALKPVTVRVARALLTGGQKAIDGAIAGAKQPWYKSDLPGVKRRDEVAGKLRWHAETLAKITGDPNALYRSGDDLKRWTMNAYIEANAVSEGAAYLNMAWSQMWQEITAALAAIPRQVRDAMIAAASGTVEAVTGIPIWGWFALGIATLVGTGLLVWKLVTSKTGTAITGVAIRRYLP